MRTKRSLCAHIRSSTITEPGISKHQMDKDIILAVFIVPNDQNETSKHQLRMNKNTYQGVINPTTPNGSFKT